MATTSEARTDAPLTREEAALRRRILIVAARLPIELNEDRDRLRARVRPLVEIEYDDDPTAWPRTPWWAKVEWDEARMLDDRGPFVLGRTRVEALRKLLALCVRLVERRSKDDARALARARR